MDELKNFCEQPLAQRRLIQIHLSKALSNNPTPMARQDRSSSIDSNDGMRSPTSKLVGGVSFIIGKNNSEKQHDDEQKFAYSQRMLSQSIQSIQQSPRSQLQDIENLHEQSQILLHQENER